MEADEWHEHNREEEEMAKVLYVVSVDSTCWRVFRIEVCETGKLAVVFKRTSWFGGQDLRKVTVRSVPPW